MQNSSILLAVKTVFYHLGSLVPGESWALVSDSLAIFSVYLGPVHHISILHKVHSTVYLLL